MTAQEKWSLSQIKDILGIGVILAGAVGTIVAGAVYIHDLENRVAAREAEALTDRATALSQFDALKTKIEEDYKRLSQVSSSVQSGTPLAKAPPSVSLKEQQCVSLSEQRRSARGKTAAAVQAAMNSLGCSS